MYPDSETALNSQSSRHVQKEFINEIQCLKRSLL